ncbi:MAG TPA: DUF2752 domain-containing protein [Thermoanaerobaculia bacterium]|nr:DUF2752 domain-containing protein [Thermoanaerobaculia bacterium]
MRSVRAEERWASALFVSLSLAALLALAWRSPQSWGIPPCPFFYFTGLFCPGCGTLRAVHALLRGDLVRAFGLNPLLILFLPYIGFFWLSQAVAALTAKQWSRPASPRWGWAAFALIVSFWMLRNLPGEAFEVLRP